MLKNRPRKFFPIKRRNAFTLIELLVVISIIGILVGGGVAAFNSFARRQSLVQATKDLEAVLKDAQSRALSSVDGKNWGVHLNKNGEGVELFSTSDLSYNNASERLPRPISSGVSISSLNLQGPLIDSDPGTVNVVFSVLDGAVSFTDNNGTCRGGSQDSDCAVVQASCLGIELNLQGAATNRYLKINERNIFEDDNITCP